MRTPTWGRSSPVLITPARSSSFRGSRASSTRSTTASRASRPATVKQTRCSSRSARPAVRSWASRSLPCAAARSRGAGRPEEADVPTLRDRLATNEKVAGWVFVLPVLIGIGVFLIVPIGMALWMSFTDWNGLSPPGDAQNVGLDNYRDLLSEPGVPRLDFAMSIRNNLYYVLGVVPAQTAIAFVLAVVVNQKFLRGKAFFRTAYYFPSITSSIAISIVFLFLFQRSGAINQTISALMPGDDFRLNWLDNAEGVLHNVLGAVGVDSAPGFLADNDIMGLSLWQWLSGPSVTMFAIMMLATWTTIGTMMLIFLAGLQNIPADVEEASRVDGATALQRFRLVTIPMMKQPMFFVLTIGLIGTWQVFDQIFVISSGGPQKTTLTPAYLIYREGFQNFSMGRATAIAFLLFVLIMVLTLVQRRILRPDRD
ncbi:ABC transporter permease subunit [Phytoactinopolyspora alkaliphila]|uniref:ABC transporter permease subunit n=1 Tax=Phytoactinopolyspora alkaliphila TaxID=1783498 RepID=A0A6N9YH07_9ACTN|nr:ABC transporter permease subunit [Phytoactinopolyspora alkaliphila]